MQCSAINWLLTRERDELSVYPKRRKTMDLYMKVREGKPNADCQSRSPMPSTSAEPSSSPWGQARPMGASEAGGGRRGWWGQARPMGAASHRPHARARQHRTLGKPPGQIPSQHWREFFLCQRIGKQMQSVKDVEIQSENGLIFQLRIEQDGSSNNVQHQKYMRGRVVQQAL